MPRWTYGGDQAVTYPQYLDVGGDRPTALVAEPGRSYEIRPAEGHTVLNEKGERVPLELPVPPDDRWKRSAPAGQSAAQRDEQARREADEKNKETP